MNAKGRAAFLFPGQLSEWVGMGKDFLEHDPAAADLCAFTSRRCGRDLRRLMLGGPEADLRENLAAQAAVFMLSTLAARALEERGVAASATAGYSLGNYAAMVACGAISYEEALEVLVAVWEATERLGIRGAMGAVIGARREAVDAELEALRAGGRSVWIGNVNASTQFVLTGTREGVGAALETLRPKSLSVLPLTMSWPIHSMLMEPVARAIAPLVASLESIRDPRVPYYGPEGRAVGGGEDVRRLLGTAFCHPTLWKETFESMVAADHRLFLEVGPGELLTKMVRWIDRSTRCVPAGTRAAIDAAADIVAAG